MKRAFTAFLFSISAIALLAGCARHADGSRMTLGEQWKAMAARQDAAARNFVNTDMDGGNPVTTPVDPSGIPDRSDHLKGGSTF